MPALSKKNQRERRRFTAVIITYGKRGQGHRRGDEQETWRRRLLFTTARRNPSAPAAPPTAPEHGDDHAAHTSITFSAGLIGSNRGGGETGEVETWEDFGYLSDNVGVLLQIWVAPPRDTWRADWEPDGQQVVNRWCTIGLRCTVTILSCYTVHSDHIARVCVSGDHSDRVTQVEVPLMNFRLRPVRREKKRRNK